MGRLTRNKLANDLRTGKEASGAEEQHLLASPSVVYLKDRVYK